LHSEFREFVKFLAYVNKCALCILHSGKLIENLCSQIFNNFFLEYIQQRLLRTDRPKLVRSTIQYCIQMLQMFTCHHLTKVVFFFFFGLPSDLQNTEDSYGVARQSTMSIEKFESLIDSFDRGQV